MNNGAYIFGIVVVCTLPQRPDSRQRTRQKLWAAKEKVEMVLGWEGSHS